MSNSIFCIHPYRLGTAWVFDDAPRGLTAEPFVAGIPAMIQFFLDKKGKADADKFTLYFSSIPFPGHEIVLTKSNDLHGGAYYEVEQPVQMTGWLCPALTKYYTEELPEKIYVNLE